MVANKTEGILQTFVHVQDGGKIQQMPSQKRSGVICLAAQDLSWTKAD